MKGRSEKLYDPRSLDVHFCHAKFLCDKHFSIVESLNSPFTSLWRVIPRPITFMLSQYVNQDHAALSFICSSSSLTSQSVVKNSRPPKPICLSLSVVLIIKYSSITCVATHNLTSRQQL